MNPGALKQKINILARNGSQTEGGYVNPDPALVCCVRARRADASSREVWEAYAAKARNIVNWEIRARDDIETGMLVECGGQLHEIIAVQRPGGAPPRMILKTTLKEATT